MARLRNYYKNNPFTTTTAPPQPKRRTSQRGNNDYVSALPTGTAKVWYFRPARSWAVETAIIPDKKERDEFFFFFKADCDAEFNSLAKTWLVPEGKYDACLDLLRLNFREVEVEPKPAERARATQPMAAVRIDHLAIFIRICGLRPATLAEAKAVYRRTAVALHPDHGGDPSLMSDLNVAWTALQASGELPVA